MLYLSCDFSSSAAGPLTTSSNSMPSMTGLGSIHNSLASHQQTSVNPMNSSMNSSSMNGLSSGLGSSQNDTLSQAYSGIQQYAGLSGLLGQGLGQGLSQGLGQGQGNSGSLSLQMSCRRRGPAVTFCDVPGSCIHSVSYL